MEKKLYRSRTDKKLAGVCGGIAAYFGIDSTLIRLAWALLTIFAGASIWIYIVAALVMSEEPAYTPYQDVNGQYNPYNQQPPYNQPNSCNDQQQPPFNN